MSATEASQAVHQSSSLDDMAERMYGPSPAPAEAAKPIPGTIEDMASRMPYAAPETGEGQPPAFDIQVPDAVLALRGEDAGRQVYGVQDTYRDALPDNLLAQHEDMPEAQQKASIAEFREMVADLGASNEDVISFRRISTTQTEAPTDAQRMEWREQAVQALNEEFGQGASQAYKDAAKFASRDPRWVQMLEDKGLGDHPEIIMRFARLAQQARRDGRLK
jgi:hypothetical protein